MTSHKIKDKESGFAIILTLGFLSLFMMTALLFTFTAISNRKAANAYNSLTTSRISAQSGLNRALVSINHIISKRIDLINVLNNGEIHSESQPGLSNEQQEELLVGGNSLLNTTIDNIVYYNVEEDYTDSHPTWQYFPINHNAANPITTRVAYKVLPELGKIDVTTCVDTASNAISEDDDKNTSADVKGRPGVKTNEIFLETLFQNYISDNDDEASDLAKKISSANASPKGIISDDEKDNMWRQSIVKLCEDLGIDVKDPSNYKKILEFYKIFNLKQNPQKEAFWVDDGDKKQENDELYHRFNLARTDDDCKGDSEKSWNDIAVDDIVEKKNNLIKYSTNDDGNIEKCIPWIANWSNAGSFKTSKYRAKQIAANLIDYCDDNSLPRNDWNFIPSDSDITSDSDFVSTNDASANPDTWTGKAGTENGPTYVGLEKCPYINELKMEVEGNTIEKSTGYGYTFYALGKLDIEAVLVYFDDTAKNFIAHADGDLKLDGCTDESGDDKHNATFTYGGSSGKAILYANNGSPITLNTDSVNPKQKSLFPEDLTYYKEIAESNNTYFDGDVTITNTSITCNGVNSPFNPQNAAIYSTGNITFTSDFSGLITLISEGYIKSENQLTVFPALDNTTMIAMGGESSSGGRRGGTEMIGIKLSKIKTIEGEFVSKEKIDMTATNGNINFKNINIISDNDIKLNLYKAYDSKVHFNLDSNSSKGTYTYNCNVNLNNLQLELANLYNDMILDLDSSNCWADITIEGSYDFIASASNNDSSYSSNDSYISYDNCCSYFSYSPNYRPNSRNSSSKTESEPETITRTVSFKRKAHIPIDDVKELGYHYKDSDDKNYSTTKFYDSAKLENNKPILSSTIIPNEIIESSYDRDCSISNFKINILNVKLLYNNEELKLLDYSGIRGGVNPSLTEAYKISGPININPGSSSSSHPFIIQTADGGELSIDDVNDWPTDKTYTCTATEIKVNPKSPGQDGNLLRINDKEVELDTNEYYTFTGDMTVKLYNTKYSSNSAYSSATGQWWMDISGDNVQITPSPFSSKDKYSSINDIDELVPSDETNRTLYLDYEVADPRQNHNEGDWVLTKTTDDTNTLGEKNSNFTPDNGPDAEPKAEEPWDISTVYIRNAPMNSPWELGFIHRGAAFETVNLKNYNDNDDIGTGGGSDYSSGDANILDQIKMTPEIKTSSAKINVNSKLEEILTALFQKVEVGCNVDSPGISVDANSASSKEVDFSYASALASELRKCADPKEGGSFFLTRAQIVRADKGLSSALSTDGVVQNTNIKLNRESDAQQEEIIGKIINLTDSSIIPNTFNIIVVSQAIKDIGGDNGSGITILRDLNHDGDTKDKNEKIIGCKKGTYEPYADSILSTQKIFATVIRDADSGKLKVKRYEYVE